MIYFKAILVPLFEGYFRLRDRLALACLRLKRQSTVISITNSDALLSVDRVIVFAAHPHQDIASFHIRFLEKWERRGYGIIIVSHHTRAASILQPFADRGWCVMLRRPFGRDFGCYRDASILLYDLERSTGRSISRIVYCNDSVVTMDTREEAIITHLDGRQRHFAGVTDNYDKGYHISSYLFAISGEVFHHHKVRRYWRRYKSLSTRRYAIGRGEVGFSRCVIRAGFLAQVQWPISRLKSRLAGLSLDQISIIAESMESHFRATTKHPLLMMQEGVGEFSGVRDQARTSNAPKSWFRPTWKGHPDGSKRLVESEQDFGVPELSPARRSEVISRAARDRVIDSMVRYIFRGSHIHHGAAPLLFIGAGLLKKDVILRKIIEPYNIEKILMESGACQSFESEEIMLEILAKEHPKSFRGYRALMLRWDFI